MSDLTLSCVFHEQECDLKTQSLLPVFPSRSLLSPRTWWPPQSPVPRFVTPWDVRSCSGRWRGDGWRRSRPRSRRRERSGRRRRPRRPALAASGGRGGAGVERVFLACCSIILSLYTQPHSQGRTLPSSSMRSELQNVAQKPFPISVATRSRNPLSLGCVSQSFTPGYPCTRRPSPSITTSPSSLAVKRAEPRFSLLKKPSFTTWPVSLGQRERGQGRCRTFEATNTRRLVLFRL